MTIFVLLSLFTSDFYMGPAVAVAYDPVEVRLSALEKSAAKLKDENVALRVRVEVLETKLNAITAARAAASSVVAPAPAVSQSPIQPAAPYRQYGDPTIIYESSPQRVQSGPCRNGVCPQPRRR